jgi:hypothetical protein
MEGRPADGESNNAATHGEPELAVAVIRGRQHQLLQAAMVSMVMEAGSP